jgi:hypothetical protein
VLNECLGDLSVIELPTHYFMGMKLGAGRVQWEYFPVIRPIMDPGTSRFRATKSPGREQVTAEGRTP